MARSRRFAVQIAAGSLLLVVLVALVVSELWRSTNSARPELEKLVAYGSVPAFSLTERSTKAISARDLLGKVWVVDFIYTRCTDTCPLQSATMARLQEEFGHDADFQLVSITVDPRYDSPEVLAGYAERYGANPERWLFLTGDPVEIKELVQEGFRLSAVSVGRESDDPVIFHSSRFILVDRAGEVRGYYDSSDKNALDRLRNNARTLLSQGA